MKKFIFPLLLLLSSCQLINEERETQEITDLEELYNKIVSISESKSCTNSSQWKFTAIGSKACGGPSGYIAYSSEINESEFLDLVAQYTKLQKEYNTKNNIGSDCSLVASPSSITCENGKPVFVY